MAIKGPLEIDGVFGSQIRDIQGEMLSIESEASRLMSVSKQTIKNNLLGKFKSAKGMNFRYVD
jgi:hypothetical protein